MKQSRDIDTWLEERRKFLKTVPRSIIPKKTPRGPESRSFEKRRALAIACKKAWDDKIASGEIVVTEKGYKLC